MRPPLCRVANWTAVPVCKNSTKPRSEPKLKLNTNYLLIVVVVGVAAGAVALASTGAGLSSLGTLAVSANAFGAAALQLSTWADTVGVAVSALHGHPRLLFHTESSVQQGSSNLSHPFRDHTVTMQNFVAITWNKEQFLLGAMADDSSFSDNSDGPSVVGTHSENNCVDSIATS